ncbi:oxidoreductase NAD-binding domain-containing protein [Colletotrichum scovillei]|uniref:NADH-cytochrome b5 reductase n=1 Tax=Colletotrichum scovillei TaxID=1209932 RepID=A0A9P7RKN0_9PEZI|nr:oxidoreductase NAD-binding domain-containing protein [Colletotrichum scovillei]KAF4777957.1 oxidoreductase NAD-binding domain-containing protein [Colletotrichum scovillei]KAG7058935.1 oxidoreductase NAD-binding domain-containing protein [Colletotrichum scovillei]KAG7077585.1 oxidoreductase NAD-binding domain-containing protein [Colletotrichum scovillei]KAG7084747.1 oxidoreductase NAD-binding domain-containing protein [Colletotrichum scovillei]
MASVTLRRVRPATIAATVAAGGIGLAAYSRLFVNSASAESGAPPKVFGAGPAFVSLALESSEDVNHNTKRLRFKLPQREAVSGLSLTSAVLTMSWPEGRWLPVARPYTPVQPLDDTGYLELMVKKYPDGKQSTHIHSLTPGQKLLFALAIKGHQWKPNSYSHITLIAGGAGITPIYQLAQGILRNPEDKTAITLVFGVNSDQDVLLKQEFEQFEKEFPGRFKAVYTVSNPVANSPYRKGYVTKQLLEEVGVAPKKEDTKVFVCGPPAMEAALVGKRSAPGVLQQLGYRKDQIHQF